jgi:3-phenylpropionate/trans-cinnamate dioxygenase ferredoxin subunit
MRASKEKEHQMSLPFMLLCTLYLLLGFVPGFIFFVDKGGFAILKGLDFQATASVIFPLFGLYAFFLIWGQIIIGSSMPVLRRHAAWIGTFHRAQGTFALLLGITHPLLLGASVGSKDFFSLAFVSPEQRIFALLGVVQLLVLILTATTALLMKLPFLVNRWHYIHYLNYVLFVFIFVHSWNLGSDLSSNQTLRVLWCVLAISAAASTLARLTRSRIQVEKGAQAVKKAPEQDPVSPPITSEEFVCVASVEELSLGTPKCTTVKEKSMVLCKTAEGIFGIDDTCSHAGGSLCKGKLDGTIIQCPRHGARFDVRTGAVMAPPAKVPQQVYKTRINGDKIEVML